MHAENTGFRCLLYLVEPRYTLPSNTTVPYWGIYNKVCDTYMTLRLILMQKGSFLLLLCKAIQLSSSSSSWFYSFPELPTAPQREETQTQISELLCCFKPQDIYAFVDHYKSINLNLTWGKANQPAILSASFSHMCEHLNATLTVTPDNRCHVCRSQSWTTAGLPACNHLV